MPKKVVPTGTVGVLNGGIIKQGIVRYFVTDNDLDDEYKKFKDYYGPNLSGRYVKTEDVQGVLTQVKKKLEDLKVNKIGEDIYEISVQNAINIVKDISGEKRASLLGDDDDKKKKEDSDSDSDDDKPKKVEKKEVKKVEKKKDDSDSDSDDDKPKKVEKKDTKKEEPKKEVKKVEKKKDDSDSDSEEEKPKKVEKKESKKDDKKDDKKEATKKKK